MRPWDWSTYLPNERGAHKRPLQHPWLALNHQGSRLEPSAVNFIAIRSFDDNDDCVLKDAEEWEMALGVSIKSASLSPTYIIYCWLAGYV